MGGDPCTPCTFPLFHFFHFSTLSTLRIAGGIVFDPANGIDGDTRDICIDGGRIVADLPPGAPSIDAGGMVVMPGGVDIHSHVAGTSVNQARGLLPEEHDADPAPAPELSPQEPPARSGTGGTVPTTFTMLCFALLTTALVASWIPAERATRVDPSATLRSD